MTPGSPEEVAAFQRLQARLPGLFARVTHDRRQPQTLVVVPSLSLDPEELAKVTGVHHYEERMLYMLMLLRRPRTRLVFVTSQQIDPIIIDYFLHLLTGIPSSHARERLTLLYCSDASKLPLSAKVLARPRLLERIKAAIPDPENAHLVVFNSSHWERSLAVQLGIPLYANDPDLYYLGTKSGCRRTFAEAGVLHPDGYEDLRDGEDIAEALTRLKERHPASRRAVVKLNDGFSGEGNALFYYDGCPEGSHNERKAWVRENLINLKFEAPGEHWERYHKKFREMQGVVELFVEGQIKRSPSSQNRVNALGQAMSISTHDQVLGGPSGQVFLGCTFPADEEYRKSIQDAGLRIAQALGKKGVIGRFATDFVSVKEGDHWRHYAIEVNLRKGGTTHPFLTLRFLTDGSFDEQTGLFYSQSGRPKYYYASDSVQSDHYKGTGPADLVDLAVMNELHYHSATDRGVVFHLIGALSEFGKLGMVCIGDNRQQAEFLYRRTRQVLDLVTRRT
ncbi:MAG TPA: peptide ligase PGM1-related protein [Myxococcota bacterium]|nr:peptide ligase PGM1-related protein [Myxococcota bacterium]